MIRLRLLCILSYWLFRRVSLCPDRIVPLNAHTTPAACSLQWNDTHNFGCAHHYPLRRLASWPFLNFLGAVFVFSNHHLWLSTHLGIDPYWFIDRLWGWGQDQCMRNVTVFHRSPGHLSPVQQYTLYIVSTPFGYILNIIMHLWQVVA